MRKEVNTLEFWCYRRILKISWRDKVKNDEILKRLQKMLHFVEDMMKRKLRYAGHVLRGSSGLSHLQVLEGYVKGKIKVGRPRRAWMKDIIEWTGLGDYGKVKRATEERKSWKLIVVNLRYRYEDDK